VVGRPLQSISCTMWTEVPPSKGRTVFVVQLGPVNVKKRAGLKGGANRSSIWKPSLQNTIGFLRGNPPRSKPARVRIRRQVCVANLVFFWHYGGSNIFHHRPLVRDLFCWSNGGNHRFRYLHRIGRSRRNQICATREVSLLPVGMGTPTASGATRAISIMALPLIGAAPLRIGFDARGTLVIQ